MKLLIIGHGRHGKDTVAEILRDYFGRNFRSSSNWAAEHVVQPAALVSSWRGGNDIYVPNWQELYENRHDATLPFCGRQFWFDTLLAYNKEHGGSAIARGLLEEVDVYVGMRSRYEFEEAQKEGLFDRVIWVDRSEHEPPEGGSMELTADDADLIVDNNGTMQDLWHEVDALEAQLARAERLKGTRHDG